MGNRLKHQRRGRGTSVFKAKARGLESAYVSYENKQKESVLQGQVINLIKENGRDAIMAQMLFENNEISHIVTAEGMIVGQHVEYGKDAGIVIGNALPLANIPEGCPVFNIEKSPGDGGKFVRGTGSYALLVSKDGKRANLKMPSGKSMAVNLLSRATVGCVAGGGRTEKPFVKAGNMWHRMKSRSRPYPVVRGIAMNPIAHPFGGGQHHAGGSKSTSRHAHPGRKVGNIASRRTGRKKKN
ncbi:MAG: 50S ribosomal protein L2 [Candidatus Diapherotrites archaeon]|uniref:50S ribosomal protein L2 n=1 Tax=Candidatus Iainarchaeum sp. TaxID=3101447 RepID=A0A2D6M0P2_9ARCH|nr:50S ribosomal protein L2 [Candidatus Diapherotrites archaeon]|tara:strand:- start:1372 stop:2094 length:723 start_codon:yes stop_codon:yes gene_type:complete